MNDGGVTVTKTTTGSVYLQDIQVVVTHQEAVYIPAEKALNSVDLHRALSSGAIFQMLNTMHTKPADTARAVVLEEENRLLREALHKSTQQSANLQQSVEGLSKQMELLAEVVGRIGTERIVVQGPPAGTTVIANPDVVGGDIPMFIPDQIVPTGADVQVAVKETLTEGDDVSAARNRLRQLRKG
jgi:hypothetical protein